MYPWQNLIFRCKSANFFTLTPSLSLVSLSNLTSLTAVLAIGKCLCPKDLFTTRQCTHTRLQSETDRERKICRGDEWEFSFLVCLLFVVCVCVTAVQLVSVLLSHRETSGWILDFIRNISRKTWSRKGWHISLCENDQSPVTWCDK